MDSTFPTSFPASTVIQKIRDNMDLLVLMPKSFLLHYGKANKVTLLVKGIKFKVYFSPLDLTGAYCPALVSYCMPDTMGQYYRLLEVLQPLALDNKEILGQLMDGLAKRSSAAAVPPPPPAIPLIDLTQEGSTSIGNQAKRKLTGTVASRPQRLSFPYYQHYTKPKNCTVTSMTVSAEPRQELPQPSSQGLYMSPYNSVGMFTAPYNKADNHANNQATSAGVSHEPITGDYCSLQLASQNSTFPRQQPLHTTATNSNMVPYTETRARSFTPQPYVDYSVVASPGEQWLKPVPERANYLAGATPVPYYNPMVYESYSRSSRNSGRDKNIANTYYMGNQGISLGYGDYQQWKPRSNQLSSSLTLLPSLVNRLGISTSSEFKTSYLQVLPSVNNNRSGNNNRLYPASSHNIEWQPASPYNNGLQPASLYNNGLQPAFANNNQLQPAFHDNNELQPAFHSNNELQPEFHDNNELQPEFYDNNELQPAFHDNNELQPAFHDNNEAQPVSPNNNEAQPVSPNNNEAQPVSPNNNEAQPASPDNNEAQPASSYKIRSPGIYNENDRQSQMPDSTFGDNTMLTAQDNFPVAIEGVQMSNDDMASTEMENLPSGNDMIGDDAPADDVPGSDHDDNAQLN